MINSLLSIFLSILLFTNNLNIVFTSHYCWGIPIESAFSFGNGNLDCGMNNLKEKDCTKEKQKKIVKSKNCCEDLFTSFSIKLKNLQRAVSLSHINFQFIYVISYLRLVNIILLDIYQFSFKNYFSPKIPKDRSIFFQVFRI